MLQVGVVWYWQGWLCGVFQVDFGYGVVVCFQFGQFVFQLQLCGDQDLVVVVVFGVYVVIGIVQLFGELCFDGGMVVFEVFVQYEGVGVEIFGQCVQFVFECGGFVNVDYVDVLQVFDVCFVGGDVMQEKFVIEDYVVFGEELYDVWIDLDVGFLLEGLGYC